VWSVSASEAKRSKLSLSGERLRGTLPSFGPHWDFAITQGLDVSLLLENLTLTPAQRLSRLQQVVAFHALLRNARRISE
jgi:hypothetical protein